MDRAELDLLLTPRLLAAVDAEAALPSGDPVARATALRRGGLSAAESAAVLTQAELRRRGRRKFGDFADRMLFTRVGLEQATRLEIGAHHAARLRSAGVRRVADLGCGVGGDAFAFAGLELAVLAVERDPVTAAIAQYNLAAFPEAEVRVGAAEGTDLAGVDAVWLDPARRAEGRRVGAAGVSPSLGFVADTARRLPTGVKLSPALADDDLPFEGEAQWVSSRGETAELVLWSAGLARPGVGRAALVLTPAGAAELTGAGPAADVPPGPLGDVVHEPDGAVLRARLLGDLARTTATRPVGPGIAYLTGDSPAGSPFLTSFAVDAVLPFDRQRIRRELRARGIGRLEIKKRGVVLDPAAFRAGLGLRGEADGVLIVTRALDRRVALLAHRV